MVSRPDLLLICRDTDLGLLMSFLLVIKHQTEHGVILIWDHSFYLECWHADVDQDDSIHPICQREWSFSGRNAFGGPVGP